jgi:predicted extracellular nuclease
MLAVFYNVENLFDTSDNPRTKDDAFTPDGDLEWNEKKYYQKLDQLAYVLDNIGAENIQPALIGLCEVENYTVVEALANHRRLAPMGYKIVHGDSKDQRGIDNALIYSENSFKHINHEYITIDTFAPSPLFSRDILYVKGQLNDGSILHVFVNHWPSRRTGPSKTEYKRLAAGQALRAKVDELEKEDPDVNILIMGDFNDSPVNKSVKDALRAVRVVKEKGDLINLAVAIHEKRKGSVYYNGKWSAFDQFIVSKSLLKKVSDQKMHLFDDEEVMTKTRKGVSRPKRTFAGHKHLGGFSDHLAIWLNIDLTN